MLAPPPVQQALGLGELCRLGFGTTLPPARSGWGSKTTGSTGSTACSVTGADGGGVCCAPEVRPPRIRNGCLEHELVLDNATFRLLSVTPAWTRYLVLDFRFSAVSDEKRDGMLRLGINLATGAMPDAMFEPIDALARLGGGGIRRCRTKPCRRVGARRVLDLLAEALPSAARRKTGAVPQGLAAATGAATRSGCTPTTTTSTGRRCAVSPRCRRTIRRAGARSSGQRQSGANTAPRSTILPASMRCGSRSIGCRPWS